MFSKHIFSFNGHDISEYGCFVCETPIFPTPERRVNKIEIPGRDGYLTEDEGTFNNITVTYNVIILASEVYPYSIEKVLHDIREWLLLDTSFKKLRDDNHAGGFYWARCDGLNDFEYVNDKAVKFSITFDCEPFFYFDDGEQQTLDVKSGNIFTNIGNYYSEPKIYVYNAGDKFKINDFEVNLPTETHNTSYVINSKLKLVTNLAETEDLSSYSKGTFPIFKTGKTTVTFTTDNDNVNVNISPNWRSL